MKPRVMAVLVATAIVGLPASAAAATLPVSVQFSAFAPGQQDILPGDTIEWENVSERRHTVTADDGSFDSGDLFGGQKFTRTFDSPGTFTYHCTVHDGMTGEINVRPVTLGALPTAPVPAGQAVEFEGRTADPSSPVRIERGVGASFETVATAAPASDGSWSVSVVPPATGDYRAANDAGASGSRRLLVSDRKIVVRATRSGIAVTVTPALPYGRIVVQRERRERFGWWPELRARLDYVSHASFTIKRPARVRVALVDKDGWTPLVFSRVLVLGHVKGTPAAATHH